MRWSPIAKLKPRRPVTRSQFRRGPKPVVENLETRLAPSVNVLTFHDDIASTGLNSNETTLNPQNVKVGSFSKLFTTSVDGQVYAEPLVDTNITIGPGPNTTPGVGGAHDVVFVATEHDSLYAIDANPAVNGAVLWQRSFTNINSNYIGTIAGTNINNDQSATAVSTVSSNDVGSGDVNPEIGITGTPVIDPNTNLLYVSVKSKQTIGGQTYFVQEIHVISIADGTDAAQPFLVGKTTGGNSNTTPIYVYGTGDGSVTDPYNGTGKQVVQFNALREAQRGGLSLVNNTLYANWASHGDNGPYHGWVVKWDVSNITTTGFNMTGEFCTSPNNGLAGIWQGGGRLVFEADGSAFYFVTGNGSGGAPTLNPAGFPNNANYNEAVVKVVADSSSSPTNQNPNGWGLKAADYFIPYNVAALDGADSDFGSGAPILLPDSAGIPGHPHLMVVGGKEGKLYLIDRDNMGHFNAVNDNVLNAVPNGSGNNTAPVLVSGLLSTPAYFNGNVYATSGYSGHAYSFTINPGATPPPIASLNATSQTSISSFGYLPGSPTVSANGTSNGIVWIMDLNLNELHAYDASTLNTELWNSNMKAGGGDSLGAAVKFAVPTVANGEVFVGTSNSLVVYGLAQPPTAPPNAAVLNAAALSGTAINLTWTDSTQPPNQANGYLVEESTDGTNFTQVTTAPAGATSIAIGGLAPQTKYYFFIEGFNAKGTTNSNTVNATTTNQVNLIDFSAGFTGSTPTLTYNGSAKINSNDAELTDGNGNEAGSVFSTSAVDVTGFTTQFTFQLSAGSNTADGFTFCIQGNGPTALGATGGGLGYGPGILNSVAIKFDLYNNSGEGVDSTGIYTDGSAPTVPSTDLSNTGINLHSGDTFTVNMSYDGTTLTVIETDNVTNAQATQSYPVNIPMTVGSGTAYVGFTGGTGGLVCVQNILSWTYSPTAASSPNAPSGLGATPATATSVSLTWTANATNQTGYHLDRASDMGFTQNLITENLPATPNSFTDMATGLAPGSTFYYRLRAYNAAGDSGNSNIASVTIPLAPPKPTNQQVTNVTTTEIDLSWTDNAGHQAQGYQILGAVNHGSFTQIASLPPTSRPAPSTYLWSDTGLTPGFFYEYHIIAFNTSGHNDFAGVNATTITSPPSGLTLTPSAGSITLSWGGTTGAVSYNVYRATTAGGEGSTPFATGITTTTFTDPTLPNNTTFFYEVTAVNGNLAPIPSESAVSTEVSGQTLPVHLTVSAPAGPFVAGSPFTITVKLLDQNNKAVTNYFCTIAFTKNDSGAKSSVPPNYTFKAADNGVQTFSVTLVTNGLRTVTATDTADATITGSVTRYIAPSTAAWLKVQIPGVVTAGAKVTITVTAFDAYGNQAFGYLGTIHFAGSNGGTFPSDYTFVAKDGGKHTFTNQVVLTHAGSQTVTASDTVKKWIKGSATVYVQPGAAATFGFVFPSTVTAGQGFILLVKAQDHWGNTVTGYLGTVDFTTSPQAGVLPASFTFTSANNGVASFTVTIANAGNETITATDSMNSSITGSVIVPVNAGAVALLLARSSKRATDELFASMDWA